MNRAKQCTCFNRVKGNRCRSNGKPLKPDGTNICPRHMGEGCKTQQEVRDAKKELQAAKETRNREGTLWEEQRMAEQKRAFDIAQQELQLRQAQEQARAQEVVRLANIERAQRIAMEAQLAREAEARERALVEAEARERARLEAEAREQERLQAEAKARERARLEAEAREQERLQAEAQAREREQLLEAELRERERLVEAELREQQEKLQREKEQLLQAEMQAKQRQAEKTLQEQLERERQEAIRAAMQAETIPIPQPATSPQAPPQPAPPQQRPVSPFAPLGQQQSPVEQKEPVRTSRGTQPVRTSRGTQSFQTSRAFEPIETGGSFPFAERGAQQEYAEEKETELEGALMHKLPKQIGKGAQGCAYYPPLTCAMSNKESNMDYYNNEQRRKNLVMKVTPISNGDWEERGSALVRQIDDWQDFFAPLTGESCALYLPGPTENGLPCDATSTTDPCADANWCKEPIEATNACHGTCKRDNRVIPCPRPPQENGYCWFHFQEHLDCNAVQTKAAISKDGPNAVRGYFSPYAGVPWLKYNWKNERELWNALRHLLWGLSKLKAAGIAHMDILWNNVVVDEHGTPRIIDFGIAQTQKTFQNWLLFILQANPDHDTAFWPPFLRLLLPPFTVQTLEMDYQDLAVKIMEAKTNPTTGEITQPAQYMGFYSIPLLTTPTKTWLQAGILNRNKDPGFDYVGIDAMGGRNGEEPWRHVADSHGQEAQLTKNEFVTLNWMRQPVTEEVIAPVWAQYQAAYNMWFANPHRRRGLAVPRWMRTYISDYVQHRMFDVDVYSVCWLVARTLTLKYRRSPLNPQPWDPQNFRKWYPFFATLFQHTICADLDRGGDIKVNDGTNHVYWDADQVVGFMRSVTQQLPT